MVGVQPDRIFGGLAQVLWIRTVVHDSVMHGQAAGVVCHPPNNREPARRRDLWPLDDLYARGFWSRWTFLSEEAAAQEHDRQCQKHFVHNLHFKQNSLKMIEGKVTKVNHHRRCLARLVRSHLKFCETDEPEKRRQSVSSFRRLA